MRVLVPIFGDRVLRRQTKRVIFSGGASLDKVGPRPYHFRSGPTSGPTTRPGSKKSKISVVHILAVMKCHPECLKCGKTLWRRPRPRWGSLQRSPDLHPENPTPTTLAIRVSLLASPNLFTKIRLCSELNLFYLF